MKKILFVGLVLLILGSIGVDARAWVYVPNQGDTGWQTYVYTAGADGFTGTAGFVVSNAIDNSAYSELLLDNLNRGGGGTNSGFELGNYSGFELLGPSDGLVTSLPVTSASYNVYEPVQGDFMSYQRALANGISTAAFSNSNGQPGTVGSILETAISLAPGELFSFNWAFLGNDSSPWNDFSLFYLKDQNGALVFTDGLGQIGTAPEVPIPSSLLLLSSGLLGLLGWRTRGLLKYER
jgi:hypothetical protein